MAYTLNKVGKQAFNDDDAEATNYVNTIKMLALVYSASMTNSEALESLMAAGFDVKKINSELKQRGGKGLADYAFSNFSRLTDSATDAVDGLSTLRKMMRFSHMLSSKGIFLLKEMVAHKEELDKFNVLIEGMRKRDNLPKEIKDMLGREMKLVLDSWKDLQKKQVAMVKPKEKREISTQEVLSNNFYWVVMQRMGKQAKAG